MRWRGRAPRRLGEARLNGGTGPSSPRGPRRALPRRRAGTRRRRARTRGDRRGRVLARLDAELRASWPGRRRLQPPCTGAEEVDRRGDSGVAAIAALASSGKAVLAVCADAIRRRALVERAARPARFGGGEVAIVSARLPRPTAPPLSGSRRPARGSCWRTGPRSPATLALAARFEHLVIVDPAPFVYLESSAAAVPATCTGSTAPARRSSRFACTATTGPRAPRSPPCTGPCANGAGSRALSRATSRGRSCAARAAAIRSHPSRRPARRASSPSSVSCAGPADAARALRVVSSEGTDLERSAAFVAYRDRYEEGRRYLSKRRQTPG